MKTAVLQISSQKVQLFIQEDNTLIVWMTRTYKCTSSLFPSEIIEDIVDIISEFVEIARLHSIPVWEIRAIKDLSLQMVHNSNAIIIKAQKRYNLQIHQLQPDQQAQWTWFGHTANLTLRKGPTAVIDFDPKVLRITLGHEGEILQNTTIKVDLHHFTQKYLGNSERFSTAQIRELRTEVKSLLSPIKWVTHPKNLVLSGEAVEAFGTLEFGISPDGDRHLHNLAIKRATLRKWQDFLSLSTLDNRRNLLPNHPKWWNETVLLSFLLESLCDSAFRDTFIISQGEIGLGLVMAT